MDIGEKQVLDAYVVYEQEKKKCDALVNEKRALKKRLRQLMIETDEAQKVLSRISEEYLSKKRAFSNLYDIDFDVHMKTKPGGQEYLEAKMRFESNCKSTPDSFDEKHADKRPKLDICSLN